MNNYPFIEDETIPAPGVLDSPADIEQLFLHIIFYFYEKIDSVCCGSNYAGRLYADQFKNICS